jgi:hypothetical protein
MTRLWPHQLSLAPSAYERQGGDSIPSPNAVPSASYCETEVFTFSDYWEGAEPTVRELPLPCDLPCAA